MLKLENVSKYYRTHDAVVKALFNVSTTFNNGEFVVLTGESGSGKSTLLNVISGLDTIEEGKFYIDGKSSEYYSAKDWEEYRQTRVAFIFQNYNIIDAYTCYQNIDVALMIKGLEKSARHNKTLELLELVGLTSHKDRKASKLSNGQKQRIAIARALAKDAPIIVADEPTGNLDPEAGANIIELLARIAKDKLVIMVTHHFEEVKDHATRRLRLFDGQLIEDSTLKKTQEVKVKDTVKPLPMSLAKRASLAVRNILSMPKRTLLTFMMWLFIVLTFTLTFGAYIEQTTLARGTSHPNFRNVTPHRIVVVNNDRTPFSEDDLEGFGNLNFVREVITHDAIFDLTTVMYVENPRFMFDFFQSIQVMHASMLNTYDLKEGRLPVNANEIVISDTGEYEIEDVISVFPGRRDRGTQPMQMVVTGITNARTIDSARRLYFTDDYFNDEHVTRQALLAYHSATLSHEIGWFQRVPNSDIIIDDTIPTNQAIVLQGLSTSFRNSFEDPSERPEATVGQTWQLSARSNFYLEGNATSVEVIEVINPIDGVQFNGILAVNTETIDQILDYRPYQVTLVAYDSFEAREILDQINPEHYHAVYPADYETDDEVRLVLQLLQGASSFFLLFVLYFVSFLTLKNMMLARQKDFVILRSIGASKNVLNSVVIMEMIFLMLAAGVLTSLLLFINHIVQSNLPNYFRYFGMMHFSVMAFALLTLSISLGHKFNKTIFTQSVLRALRSERL